MEIDYYFVPCLFELSHILEHYLGYKLPEHGAEAQSELIVHDSSHTGAAGTVTAAEKITISCYGGICFNHYGQLYCILTVLSVYRVQWALTRELTKAKLKLKADVFR